MKILSSEQIQELDKYTIAHEKIRSVDLMERAAAACCEWIEQNYVKSKSIFVFCGPGNNGGDGLAISRILLKSGYNVKTWTLELSSKKSDDFAVNHKLLLETDKESLQTIALKDHFPFIPENTLIIDALFGTGLSKLPEGLVAGLIRYLNDSAAEIISIDLPSGLFADHIPKADDTIMRATHTLCFQLPKFSFLFPTSAEYVGSWHLLKIGLSQKFIESAHTLVHYLDASEMKALLPMRRKFSHKGTFGHVLLLSGSKGKMGAAVIASESCIRSGAGLLTVQVPECGVQVLQTSVPEAMVFSGGHHEMISILPDVSLYNVIAAGPGTGTSVEFTQVLTEVLKKFRQPMVLDADALNVISEHPALLELIPPDSILTPHIKEFERLTGKSSNDQSRHESQKDFSRRYHVIVILKGAHTCITTPEGEVYFNSTGNPGMAKGGFGDSLTGLVAGLLGQSYSPKDAACMAVYLHGLAGDIARENFTEYGMTAKDMVRSIPLAYARLLGDSKNR